MELVKKTFKIKGEPGRYYLKAKFKPSNRRVRVFINKVSMDYKSEKTYTSFGYLLKTFNQRGKRVFYFCAVSMEELEK